MAFPTCTSLLSYKAPMKPSKSAHTVPCFPLCIVLLFGFSVFPVVVLIQKSILRGGTELKILGPALSGSLDQMSFRGSFQPKLFSDVYVRVHV